MEESLSSLKIRSRKRKEISLPSSNSKPSMCVLTRSKSGKYIHQNSSGISRADPVRTEHVPKTESVEAVLEVNCDDASRVPLVKDLRSKRVYTPDVNSVSREEEEEEKNGERKKLLKCSDAIVDELEKSVIVKSEALNRGCRRKVFKTASSVNYRRLLPHLMDIVNDASGVSKIEIVDAATPCKLQKLDRLNSEVRPIAQNTYAAKIGRVVPHVDGLKPSENQDLEKVLVKVPFIEPDLSGVENELGQAEELEVERKLNKNDMNGVDASVEEECIQTTPPDSCGIFTETEVSHGGESVEGKKVLAENQMCMRFSVGSDKSNGDALKLSPNTKCGTDSMNRMVLNPCSRPRLFKNPMSLSYRRLLPFLMDISNNSCTSRKTQYPTTPVHLGEDINPASAANAERNCVNEIRTENSYEKQHTEDLTQNMVSSMVPLPPSDGSSHDISNSLVSSTPESSSNNYSSNAEPSSITSEAILGERSIDSQTEEMRQIESSPTNLEQGLEWDENNSANGGIPIKQCTSEEHWPVGKQKMRLDMGLESHNGNVESNKKVDLKHNSFQIEASRALVSPNKRPLQGILKRNRRGCRGLCNCLNCTSFRLHADRAFEFSQNQMQDAEEVALELMEELSNLRLLLEKSVTENNDSAGIQLNPVAVKQACNKALEAENLAKERLSELNYDLSVHCRTPVLLQPKVTFASNVQERAIPVFDPSNSAEKRE